ncbi:conserved hypothetical protein [Candidatus Roizmanbacteria bacterium]|nr:conserved hypothetical protein [Candidatus Roizmanbacteria bacterium]
MIENFSIRRWLKSRKDALSAQDDDKNGIQFEVFSSVLEHRTNVRSYEIYERGKRKSLYEIRRAKKPTPP